MKSDLRQYCLRLPRSLYLDTVDLGGLFGVSVNQFLLTAVREYVEIQFQQEPCRVAVEKLREARKLQRAVER